MEHRPVSGRVVLFGDDPAAMDAKGLTRMRRRIGVVFQDFRLLDHLSLRDNVALPLRVAGIDVAAHAENIDTLISWVGLSKRGGAYPPELSAGEKQRTAIARAVIGAPDLVLADEPTPARAERSGRSASCGRHSRS